MIFFSDCGDPTPQNGSTLFHSTVYDSLAYITCETGFVTFDGNGDYMLINYDLIFCMYDGTWFPSSVCVKGTDLDKTDIRDLYD